MQFAFDGPSDKQPYDEELFQYRFDDSGPTLGGIVEALGLHTNFTYDTREPVDVAFVVKAPQDGSPC